jgi:predicted dehydrogenase
MQRSKRLTRRQFLKSAGAAAAAIGFPYIIPSSALGSGLIAPSDMINVGLIGCGPQGNLELGNFLSAPDCRVIAVCDLWQQPLRYTAKRVDDHYKNGTPSIESSCEMYSDFPRLLARSDIDAVQIAVPDHWHVLLGLAAAKAGKDMYLEKPLGLSIAHDLALRNAVHSTRRIFQFGTQQRSDRNFRFACELVRNRRIGELKEINVWCYGSDEQRRGRPAPVPDDFDYDTWTGPAQFKPYIRTRCQAPSPHLKTWWFDSTYSLGWIAGWGVHPLDIALWGGGELTRTAVEIEGSAHFPPDGECDTATDWDVVYSYDSGVRINFKSNPPPEEWQKRYGRNFNHGTAFEGTNGWVLVDREGIYTSPSSLLEWRPSPSGVHLYSSSGHVRNFLDCVRTRKDTVCTIDEAVRVDILCHLADIATRLGRSISWDPEKELFENDPQANRMLTRSMRSPWKL